jgi:hypothetical protein
MDSAVCRLPKVGYHVRPNREGIAAMGESQGSKRAGWHRERALFAQVRMSSAQRAHYVRWWVERSGLNEAELRQIATGIWSDRVMDEPKLDPTSQAA